MAAALEGADLVVGRILGSPQDLCSGFERIRETGMPMVVLGGEQQPNAELMELSSVPIGVAAEAHRYLAEGGPANLAQLHAFLSDTVLLTGEGFEPPAEIPAWGWLERPAVVRRALAASARPPAGRRAVLPGARGEREHRLRARAGRRDRRDRRGGRRADLLLLAARPRPTTCTTRSGTLDALDRHRARRRRQPAGDRVSAGGDDEAWDVERMAALDIPILQGLCLTSSREEWEASDDGVTPLDSATQIAIPEFDGRIITAPFSFKEIDEDGLPRYVADPERCARVAGIAVNHARLRHLPTSERKIALMLSAYPTKHSRVGNAVGLDTPVSTIRLLRRMRDEGYDLGAPGAIPGLDLDDDTEAGDALIHALIAAGGQDEEWLTSAQLTDAHVRIPAARLPALDRRPARRADGRDDRGVGRGARASCSSTTASEIVLATITAGNVVLLIQPPRGFGENPVAIYHDPDLAPSHHYLAAYRWLGSRRGGGLRRRRRRPPRQARLDGVAARQERRAVGVLRDRRRDRQPAADLPVPGQRPGRGRAGQAPRARHDRRPPDPADGARRVVRRHRPARAAARRARQHRGDGPGQAAGDPRRDLAR